MRSVVIHQHQTSFLKPFQTNFMIHLKGWIIGWIWIMMIDCKAMIHLHPMSSHTYHFIILCTLSKVQKAYFKDANLRLWDPSVLKSMLCVQAMKYLVIVQYFIAMVVLPGRFFLFCMEVTLRTIVKTLIQISSKPRAPSYAKLNILVLGGSLNFYSTVDFSSLNISESKNHQFRFFEKSGTKEHSGYSKIV